MTKACKELSPPIGIGEAVLTEGFGIRAKVIHTPCPIGDCGEYYEKEFLRNCYRNSLKCAVDHNYKSIAFPLISAGGNGFTKDLLIGVAVNTIKQFLIRNKIEVYLCIFANDSYTDPLSGVSAANDELEARFRNLAAPVRTYLPHLIKSKGKKNAKVYRGAGISKRVFYSIVGKNEDYQPSKSHLLSIAIALELTLLETEALLASAGLALSESDKSDVIISYFIERSNYYFEDINETLKKHNLPPIGEVKRQKGGKNGR
jgi:hypothetical protein